MVTVIACETFPYDGITRRKGVAFDAAPQDADILVRIGKVRLADGDSIAPDPDPIPARRPSRRRTRRVSLDA